MCTSMPTASWDSRIVPWRARHRLAFTWPLAGPFGAALLAGLAILSVQ